MTQNDGTTGKIIRRRGLIQGRHVSESIQESPECIFDPSRYAYMRGYYGLLMEDAICSVSDGRFGEREVPCELLNR